MKSQKRITTREKAVIVYSLLFPETDRDELFRAAYDGSDEEFSKLKNKGAQSYHWMNTKKVSDFMESARASLERLNLKAVGV